MAAADIARHLSFTDANRDRSLQKYIQSLEKWEAEIPGYLKQSSDTNFRVEVLKLKETFEKLKLCYEEHESKRLFLAALKNRDEMIPSKELLDKTGAEIEECKRHLGDIRLTADKLREALQCAIQELADAFGKFEEEKRALVVDLQRMKRIMDESARVEVEEIKSNSRLSARATSLLQVARTFEGLSGVVLQEIQDNVIIVRLQTQGQEHLVSLVFSPGSTESLCDASLHTPDVPYEDVLEEALRTRDAVFFLLEIQQRLINWNRILLEVEQILQRFPRLLVSVRGFNVTFASQSHAFTLTLRIGSNYPDSPKIILPSGTDFPSQGVKKKLRDSSSLLGAAAVFCDAFERD